jgi:hypothetical protein
VGLAEYVGAHKQAVERDLLTQTGYTLEDVGRTLSWSALGSFLHEAKPDSAIVAETNPEISEWSTIFKTNVILADIYDVLNWFRVCMMAKGGKQRPQKPNEYPRSWRKTNKAFKTVMKAKEWLSMIGGGKDGTRR